MAQISEKITDADDKIAPWWVTLAQNDLPNSEPEGIDDWKINDDADLERIDMTHVPFVTIDGESTKIWMMRFTRRRKRTVILN